ncbi:MAG: excinuclease ABC subunit UvrC [Candidatus Latescibacteria bacterium]|nr:excinuclease ABC subunit UvrC [Candidatus Latescibacterota bacterium]NIM66336.1 excinuclease ABC subunit UvrC [Candidatus Latescibacterota bacterium]NIO02815.1 excinuclease ABC subunit UvrC [Candidatus Latescibacterota bacterium]NIO29950.1 excinuclease ABC subunit UvrC [Candidatus Latescibacterota bacterium]NIO57565.1 excinuclease ABC subunit UvrC [Candidatus Latescibacterota bacterium]
MISPTTAQRIKDQIERLPHSPGVYLFKDKNGEVIYVGKARDLKNRVRSYLREGGDSRHHIQFLMVRASEVDSIVTETEQEALILENNLIKKHRPRYNIFLKDDKTYVNLRMNINHPYPRLTVVRNPRSDGALYFGPFASAGAVRATLRTIGRIFPLRTCTDAELKIRKRACLYYHIERCPGPCVDLIDPQEYRETVNKVVMFLKGKGNELMRSLKKRMELQSAERRYEEAARTRDQIWAIQRTVEKQRITSPQKAERDVFGAYHENERMVIQGLYVRDGKLSGGDVFTFNNANLSTGEHFSSFLSQYYQRGAVIPSEVIVSNDVPEKDTLEAFLSSRKKEKVKILFPKRGERRALLKLALKNAKVVAKEKGPSSRNRDLLEDLKELLGLQKFPRRIECFDVSNIRGRHAVASRVTFIDGEPAKSLYRHYRIKTVEGADDYRMMGETLERRVSRGLKEGDLPDLLLLDGGRGQLNVAIKILERLGAVEVDAVGIAKVREGSKRAASGGTGTARRRARDKERIYIRGLSKPLLLEGNSTALFLLQRIRDEAHRFAIGYHKKLRSKKMGASALDDVPGVGPVLKSRILAEFGSIARLQKATTDQIASVPGVSKKLAIDIKEYFE